MSIAVPAFALVSAGAAHAQDTVVRRHGGGLFDFLFGRRQREQPVQPAPQKRRAPSARSSGGSGSSSVSAPQPEAVDKLDNARTVLVVGDFMAGGLAEGLDDAYAQSPGVKIEARANGSSGFVRKDYYDWQGEIAGIIEEVKPAAVVVMIGSNDRQQLSIDGNREDVRSDAWTREYTQRVRQFAAEIRRARVPLLWVGLPTFKLSSMSADILAFNDIYRDVSQEVGGEFIDIWDGFVDENGAFAPVGPDMNGQRVRLRGSDGINLTSAGKRKVAFYVEKPLNKLLGNAAAPGIASLGPDTGLGLGMGVRNPAEIDRTQPIALGDPSLDGSASLLGAQTDAASDRKLGTPVEKLVQDGIAPAGQPGRADDFATVKKPPTESGSSTEGEVSSLPAQAPAAASR